MNTKAFTIIALIPALAACNGGKNTYDASGVFETTEVTVSAEGNGKIEWFKIEEGDKVNAGDTLGCIDTTQLHLTKVQLESNMKAIGSGKYDVTKQIASLKQQMSKQNRELERFTKLAAAGASGQKTVDDIEAQISVLEKQIAAQEEILQNANSGISGQTTALEAQILMIEDRIRKCVITSPLDGIILSKYAEAGELAGQGRALFKVADTENIKIRAYVTADQLTELKLGQEMKVYADLGKKGRKEYAGKLIWISDQAEFTPKTIQTRDERANLVYAVKIGVKNDGLIKLGMYGEVKF